MHLGRLTRWGAAAIAGASLITFGSSPVAAAPTVSDGAASHAATTSTTSTTGQITLTGSGNLNSPPPLSSGAVAFNSTGRANILGAPSSNGGTHRPSAIPITAATPLSSNGTLLHSFDGVSDLDNASTTGFILTPPDQGLCVGPLALAGQEVVIEPVNITFNVYSTSGTALFPSGFPLSFLYGEPNFPSEFISDPRCHYDAATKDFFFTVLAFNLSGTESHLDVSVLRQDGSFNTYKIDTTDPGGRGCPCFADQPLLGMDSQNLYISGNEYPINQPSPYYDGAEIFAISKSQLAAGVTANFAEFSNLSDGGILIETLQPAITDTSAPAEYFLHSFTVDVNGNNSNFDNRLGVFAMTHQSAVTAGGTPTLSSPTIVTTESYVQPNLALQPSNVNLNPDDDRMQQVQYMKGSLYGALSTAVSVPNDGVRDGIAWFQLKPSVSGSTVHATVGHQGYVGAAGTYLLYPAIESNYKGVVEIAFSMSSATMNPSSAYVVGSTAGFSAIKLAAAGNGTYADTFTCTGSGPPGCRWGDYSYAVFDGTSDEIWMGSEYVPPISRQISDANWGTRVYEVKA